MQWALDTVEHPTAWAMFMPCRREVGAGTLFCALARDRRSLADGPRDIFGCHRGTPPVGMVVKAVDHTCKFQWRMSQQCRNAQRFKRRVDRVCRLGHHVLGGESRTSKVPQSMTFTPFVEVPRTRGKIEPLRARMARRHGCKEGKKNSREPEDWSSSAGNSGRRDWTRTNDPHHVKVVL